MRKLSALFLLISTNIFAQDLRAPIPEDESIKKGVLPNGLTYYIKSTDVVKDAASYYIIQNVGSVLENDDQQGLAHFLEHMAFNGTENFKGKGILNTFEEKGLVFGRDINAYTSFDETVYNINNVPTTPELIEKGLLVLHDWCNYLLLTDEEVDAERGVIKEEWRTRQTGQMRLFQSSLPITFNHSKYAERLPIGSMSVVENFEYQALRDFYHDWYRTDLQAIAVVGDIDVNAIETKIKKLFSGIPAVKNPRERFIIEVPENKKMLYSLGLDKEISTALLNFGIRHEKSSKDQTVEDLKNALLESMVTNMLSARIKEVAQKPDAHFLGASLGYKSMSRRNNVFNIRITPKPGEQQQSFAEVLTEVFRAVKFGFTSSEIDRTIKKFSNHYETQIAKKDDKHHGAIISVIKDNYLNNKTIADIEKEYAIAKTLFASFTPETLHNTIKRLYAKKNRFLNVTGVEGQNNLTEEQAHTTIDTVENNPHLTPYTEVFEGKSLISGLDINEGNIEKTENNKALGSTTYTLSNGIKVHYKFADKQKNTVAFYAISQGGNSLIKDEDLPSANLVGNLIQMSGLGEFSATELPKILAGKTASMAPGIGETTENLKGSSTSKDVETMLQLAHLHFVKPRFDEQAFQVLQGNINNYLIRRSKDVNEKIKDSITTTLYGNDNPRKRIFDREFANDISFNKMKTVYLGRFANPSDFEFFIVGDVKADQLEPLLSKYIASLPTTTNTETYKDVAASWNSSKVDEDIFLPMEDPKTNVNIAFKIINDYTVKNKLVTQALGDILQLRLTETLREEEGGVYSPRAQAFLTKAPKVLSYLSVGFDCNPELAEKLIGIVHGELSKLAIGDIKQEDLDKTLTSYKKSREQSKSNNNYDMALLTTFFRDGYNMDESKNFEDVIKGIGKKDIKTLAKQLLKKGKSYEIVFKPLKEKI
ncbi:M16 family metallopeptidase [Maribacter polysaccharolyticus]|uniref:M16 family metallopeptidase n=1 Tax=Maribacter polysaccharolyticus TaxID=3020831 RepID=UPI00237F513D|nr:M16 family metallopeptidase [Maribacter polysaccharolyticus]MDE3742778.1 insulinase family protein [Maribacter polysaccharolyticus]